MELLVIVAVAVAAIAWFLWKNRKFEQSNTHPLDGATKAPEPWTFPTSRPPEGESAPATTSVLDVNKDGKVDLKDAVAAAEVVAEKTKKTATKAKAKVKETATKAKAKVKETATKAKATVKKTTTKKTKSK